VTLGTPHLHLRATSSTSDIARDFALEGAPHGLLVTADAQTAGRGRQGRAWSAPPGTALLMSVLVRDPPEFIPLCAGVAVARVCGPQAAIKWPNDVLLPAPGGGPPARKVAGILVEGRPQERWAVVGVGVNVALRVEDLPPELHATAATLGRPPADVRVVRDALLAELERALALSDAELLGEWRERDALRGREVRWSGGAGVAAGVDGEGRLVVELEGGGRTALDSGEVHLGTGTLAPQPGD
jgi:BirA family biotin operon repressor/biotin-[acetyl-CoA-carboxylase] ligase